MKKETILTISNPGGGSLDNQKKFCKVKKENDRGNYRFYSGFTLVELLAVIVIMGVIALITTPIIIGVISSAKEQANRRSVDGLIRAGKNYLSESMIDASMAEKIRNQENLINEISYEGKGPEEGQLYVNENSDVALAVKYGDKCYKKEYTGNVEILDYNVSTCKLNINIKKPEVQIVFDNVFNEQGWSNKNFNITISTTDYSGYGISYIKWCGTSNEACEPTTEVSKSNFIIPISQETSGSKICAKAIDGFLNESEVVYSNVYKLDKTAPEFLGLTDIVINQDTVLDLESGVMFNDSLSGPEGTFTYTPTDVDRTKAGEYTITYTGKDLAGNIGTGSRKVTVHTSAPSITFTPESGKVNENGWSKTSLYVTINATDYSSYGIEKLVWCGTTNNTCTPTTEVNNASQNVLFQTENSNHHICAYAVDKFDQQSETTCSGAYKIDKTSPTIDGLMDIVINQNDILDLENGIKIIDSLSGPETTFSYSPTDVDRTKAGEYTITYTVKDLAGNIGTGSRKVTVHTSAPNITFTPESGKINENGWSKTSLYVTINATDYSSYGIEKLVWCGTTNNTCTPTSPITSGSHTILLENENNNHHICAYAVDKFGQTGTTACSEAYKIDKTVPTFTGIEDITINVGGMPNLTSGVNVTDALSGINGTYSYVPTTINTSKTGSYPVTYTVSDLAGNSKQITRNVIVTSGNPTINFTAANGAINNNGWAKSNFYVTVNASDYSGHGIDRIVWCGTTSNTCTPSTEVSGASQNILISQESNNNRICAYAIDKGGHTGSTTCSDAYKLDKTAPTAGNATITGTTGDNGWYRSDVTLSKVDGSDSLSGHASTTISRTSVTGETGGTNVTVTTTDLAGNTSTRTITIKIDKTAPTVGNVNITGILGDNGWYRSDVTLAKVDGSDSLSGHASTIISRTSVTGETSRTIVTITTKDKAGNTSTKNVTIKIDKTAPTINGLTNISVTKGGSVNLTSGVSASDNLSGMNGTFTYSPTSVDTTSTKTVTVTYTAKDKAGNIKTGTRTVTITSPTLASVIQGSPIVTSGSGLYKIGSEYRYRGGCNIHGDAGSYSCNGADPVNNYISIGGQKYRIIVMDSQGVKVQTQSKLATDRAFDNDDGSRNNSKNTFCQSYDYCGVYAAVSGNFIAEGRSGTVTQNSTLYTYLNTSGTETELVNLRNKAKNATWNIGAVTANYNVAISTIKSQEAQNTATFKMGLMNVSDYIQATLDTSCQTNPVSYPTGNVNCRNNNWLFDPNSNYPWTINTWINTSGNAYFVWNVSTNSGNLNNGAHKSYGVRPVAYLNANLTVTGGTGTASNPWVIQ